MSPLVRRTIPEHSTREILDIVTQAEVQQVERALEDEDIRTLLSQAQDLYQIKDPASTRIKRIKDTLILKVTPVFDNNEQLTLFNDLDSFAFRDGKDNNAIIVQHPDVRLHLRIKKSPVVNWEAVSRRIDNEITRIDTVLSSSQPTDERHAVLRARRDGLQWVLNQRTEQTHHRITARFLTGARRVTSGN